MYTVGNSPMLCFLAWKLSIAGSFIILVSSFMTEYGSIIWNSLEDEEQEFIPDIFTDSIHKLEGLLLKRDGYIRYKIDVVIFSSVNIKSLCQDAKLLKKFLTNDTTIMVSSDYGCELEPIVIKYLSGCINCVLSILCDIKVEKVIKGSITYDRSYDHQVYIGLTYQIRNYENNNDLVKNSNNALMELNNSFLNSSTGCMVMLLKNIPRLKVFLLFDPELMAKHVWTLIIPKLSVNILSCIFEQYDPLRLLENETTEPIIRDLIAELFKISQFQIYLPTACCPETKIKRKISKFISDLTNQYLNNVNSTPPVEIYCYCNEIEFPSQLLFDQQLNLATKYNVVCPNLSYLSGFYRRITSIYRTARSDKEAAAKYDIITSRFASHTSGNEQSLNYSYHGSIEDITFKKTNDKTKIINDIDSLEQHIIKNYIHVEVPFKSFRVRRRLIKEEAVELKFHDDIYSSAMKELDNIHDHFLNELPKFVKKYTVSQKEKSLINGHFKRQPSFENILRNNLDFITKDMVSIQKRLELSDCESNEISLTRNFIRRKYIKSGIEIWNLQRTQYQNSSFSVKPTIDTSTSTEDLLIFTTNRYDDKKSVLPDFHFASRIDNNNRKK